MAKFNGMWGDRIDDLPAELPFIVLNDQAEVFSGLKAGYPVFSESFEDAKPLERDSQFRTLERMTHLPIFKEYV